MQRILGTAGDGDDNEETSLEDSKSNECARIVALRGISTRVRQMNGLGDIQRAFDAANEFLKPVLNKGECCRYRYCYCYCYCYYCNCNYTYICILSSKTAFLLEHGLIGNCG